MAVTRRWNNATSAFESEAKHRLLGDGFAAGVKGGRNVLERFLPPARHETPTQGHEFACPFAHTDCINGRGRCGVVAWLEIARRLGQAIELDEFAPGVFLSEASHMEMLHHDSLEPVEP